MPPRDPRLDPRIGDIVSLGGTVVKVVGNRADGSVVCSLKRGRVEWGGCLDVHVNGWRNLFKEAEIVRAV